MDDPAFVKELRDWIRLNPAQALETGDGLFSKCSGGPTLPTWIGRPLFSLFFKKDAENARADKVRALARKFYMELPAALAARRDDGRLN